MEKLTSLKGIIEQAKINGPVKTAIVAPYDLATISAVQEGVSEGLIKAELFGDKKRIEQVFADNGIPPFDMTIYDCSEGAVQAAIDSIRENRNRLLMKGSVSTSTLMQACLDKSKGLNIGKICSHIIVCEIPGWDRLLIISDGGLNVLPSVDQKVDIVRNVIQLAHSIGIMEPKVAILASSEEVSFKIPANVDAAILTQMSRRGQIKGAIVDGPLALDNIVVEAAAKKKNIVSDVAGKADAIIVPNIETGNALGKSLGYFAGSINAGIVLGAAVPIILPSRAGKPEAKWGSLALGALVTNAKEE